MKRELNYDRQRYTGEDKIGDFWEGDAGKAIVEVSRERNISEQTYYRRMRPFRMIEIKEANAAHRTGAGECIIVNPLRRLLPPDSHAGGGVSHLILLVPRTTGNKSSR